MEVSPTQNDILDERFKRILLRLVHLSMRSGWKYVKEQGLSMPQMFALRYLYYKGESNISDLARELGVSTASASQMLERLVQQGLVIRQEDPNDRRNKRIRLSQKGQDVIRDSMRAYQEWVDDLLQRLTPEERRNLTEGLETLDHHLEALLSRL